MAVRRRLPDRRSSGRFPSRKLPARNDSPSRESSVDGRDAAATARSPDDSSERSPGRTGTHSESPGRPVHAADRTHRETKHTQSPVRFFHSSHGQSCRERECRLLLFPERPSWLFFLRTPHQTSSTRSHTNRRLLSPHVDRRPSPESPESGSASPENPLPLP